MRSTYGSQYFTPRYLPKWVPNDSVMAKITPQLNPYILVGVDIRQIWMAEDAPNPHQRSGFSEPFSSNTGTDAMMNGDLYLAFEPTDKVALRYTQDLRDMLRWEAYGIAYFLPFHGYVKAGQFQENYGWAFSDHSAFVRSGLWGSTYFGNPTDQPTPPYYGVGSEIGFSPNHLSISASFTDDANASIPGPADMQKRWVGRIQGQEGIQKLGLEFTGGVNGWYAPSFGGDSTRQKWWGGFGGIGWQGIANACGCNKGFGFLTTSALFEYDRKQWSPLNGSGMATPVTGAYSTSQLSVMVHPGVWLLGAYDWLDNTGKKDGNEAKRYSMGIQFFPWPWVDLTPMYRLYKPPALGTGQRTVRHGEVQAHFLF